MTEVRALPSEPPASSSSSPAESPDDTVITAAARRFPAGAGAVVAVAAGAEGRFMTPAFAETWPLTDAGTARPISWTSLSRST